MKLIITITPGQVSEDIRLALTEQKFRVTQIASTGGFLRKGNSTMLVGVEDEQLDHAIDVIKTITDQSDDKNKGVMFVIKVDRFIHF